MMSITRTNAIILSLFVLQRQESRYPTYCANGFSPSQSQQYFHNNAAHPSSPASSSSSSMHLARRSGGGGGYKPQQREEQSIAYINDDDDYDFDDDLDIIQQEERQTSAIDCPHFGTCPGCVRDDKIAEIDIVQSAKLYFSSSSVQKHIISSRNRHYNDYDDDDDEQNDFYKIKVPSPITQWRTQAKLAVAINGTWSRAAGVNIGLYQRASHKVLPIPDCRVHHPSINRAVEVITKATQKVRTPAYQEDIGQGLLRYIQFQVETSTDKVCLSLVMNAEKFKECQPHLSYLVKEIKREDPKLWHSIWCHCNDSKGNAIFSRDVTRWHPVDGPPYIRESIPGSDPNEREGLLYFSPYVFRQGNLEGFGEIARQVREAIPRGSKVCELYAGVGTLGLSALLHHGKQEEGLGWLRCSDENPENAKCFERSVNSMPMKITGRTPKKFQKNGGGKKGGRGGGRNGKFQRGGKQSDGGELSIKDLMDSMTDNDGNAAPPPKDDPSERVTYLQANAASALYRGQALGADVIIVDPPRRGLDEPVLQQLSLKHDPNQMYAEKPGLISHLPKHTVQWTNDVRTLIYVSCGFDALARDLDTLLNSSGGWELESATGYVLFPGSNHVETVVVLRR